MTGRASVSGDAVGDLVDRFGTAHSSRDHRAVSAFGDAVAACAAHRPDLAAAIDCALACDPDLVAAHALRAFGGVILARAETVAAARIARDATRTAAGKRDGLTAAEAALLEALHPALGGRLLAAADILDRHLQREPQALLLIKLSCALRFMGGDPQGMRRTTTCVLPAWRADAAGFGFVLGCHAFALEETGDLAAAERAGIEAVEREPADAWGLHAVVHVHEMTGRAADGIAWLERTRTQWTGCNNFAFHLAWHLALFHLEQGDHAKVLDLYDTEVRAVRSEDFRDIANAVSLLCRLRQHGVAVGDRWQELAQVARRRRHDTTLLFATLHHLLALCAVGDRSASNDLLLALQRIAAAEPGDQGRVAAAVGLPFARAFLSSPDDGLPCPPLEKIAVALQHLGGSHAQRDLFLRILLERAAQDDDVAALAGLLALRRAVKRDDCFVDRLTKRHRMAPLPAGAGAEATPGRQ